MTTTSAAPCCLPSPARCRLCNQPLLFAGCHCPLQCAVFTTTTTTHVLLCQKVRPPPVQSPAARVFGNIVSGSRYYACQQCWQPNTAVSPACLASLRQHGQQEYLFQHSHWQWAAVAAPLPLSLPEAAVIAFTLRHPSRTPSPWGCEDGVDLQRIIICWPAGEVAPWPRSLTGKNLQHLAWPAEEELLI